MATPYDKHSDRDLVDAEYRGELKQGLAAVMMSQRLGEKIVTLTAALDNQSTSSPALPARPHPTCSSLRTEGGKPMGLTGPGMLSRRDFINGTIGAGVALGAQGARTAKAQKNTRKRTIVDAQVHLWKAESPDWPWVPGRQPQLPEPFTIEKLVPIRTQSVKVPPMSTPI